MVKNDRFPQCSGVFLIYEDMIIGRKEELKLFRPTYRSFGDILDV